MKVSVISVNTAARVAICTVFLATPASPLYPQAPPCVNSSNVPLPDLTTPYRGMDFGLYPGRRTTVPPEYLALGVARAKNQVRPLDLDGRPSPNGRIVLMSVGMSNTWSEFARFVRDAAANPAINRRLSILNGSLSGADAAMWTNRASPAWENAISTANGGHRTSAKQVQVLWVKQAHIRTVPFPAELKSLESDLSAMLRIAESEFPNLQIVYLSSRTRAGANTRQGPGEPQAYETAFAVRGLIQRQIERRDPKVAEEPWLAWGPYLWSNGNKRSDGFVWDCGDLEQDRLHPTDSGNSKVAEQLMAFFMTNETTIPWFLEPQQGRGGGPDIGAITPSTAAGQAPLVVRFTAGASEALAHFWTFGDGTFSTAARPEKTFYLPGQYHVQLTVADRTGKWAHTSVAIDVRN